MNTTINARRFGVLTATATLALAACGSDDGTADAPTDAPDCARLIDAPESSMADDAMEEMGDDEMAMDDDAMGDMDMAMNMGDMSATPAGDVESAALSCGEFELLDTRPSGYDDVAGSAVMARSAAGTTVTTSISGLLANTRYISHVHEDPCSDNGGDHFQFVDGTVEVPPNEIHLAFTSDADGNGFMTAENAAVAPEDAVAFVVHPMEFIDNKVACVDFIVDDADAVASIIESGPTFDESSIEGMEGMNMNDMDMGAMDMDAMDHDAMDDDAMDGMEDDDAMVEMQEGEAGEHGGHGDGDHGDEDHGDEDHGDGEHGDHEDGEKVGTASDLGDVDVSALHGVDDQLAAGELDAAAQIAVVDAALAELDTVGATVGNETLIEALGELRAALEAEDLDAAAPAAKSVHDIAHSMEDHEA